MGKKRYADVKRNMTKKIIWIFGLLAMITAFGLQPDKAVAANKINVVFIIDKSYSMESQILNVRNNINSFTNSLEAQGFSYQLGLVVYDQEVTRYELTNDVNIFKNNISSISYRHNGYEHGFDAITAAAKEYVFDTNSIKYFILIGDDRITTGKTNTINKVVQLLKDNNIILTTIGIGANKTQFEGLAKETGGIFLDLYGNFGATLLEIFAQIQKIPVINLVTPTHQQWLSGQNRSFIPTVKVSDQDNDAITVSYYIDNESSPRETRTVSNTSVAQTVSFNAIDLGTLSEGDHQFKFVAYDGAVTVQELASVTIDRSPPLLNSTQFDIHDTSVQISGSAADALSGLDNNPYRYTVGTDISPWIPDVTYVKYGLQPNTRNVFKFEARDALGHVSSKELVAYTKAQIPQLKQNIIGESSAQILLTDANPASTHYLVQSGSLFLNANGEMTPSPEWIAIPGKIIEIKRLESNKNYSFQAKALNEEGIETEYSSPLMLTTLAKPPEIQATEVAQHMIQLSWNSVEGAAGYEIEVDGIVISHHLSTVYDHTGLSPNTQHTYRVRVLNSGGASNWSPFLTLFTLAAPPSTPMDVKTSAAQTAITITWDFSAGASSYEIEADGVVADAGSRTSYTHTDLLPDTEHTYRIRAKGLGGSSGWSALVTERTLPLPPDIPVQLSAEPARYSVTLRWNQAARADAYEVEADGMIVESGNKTEFVDEGLFPLTGHTYRVRAKNNGGKSAWSSPIHVTTHPEIPTAPSNIMTTAEENSISLMWYQVGNAESYEIEIDGSATVMVTDTQFIHLGLGADTKHSYRLRARNVSGYSEWSSLVTMTSLPQGSQSMTLTNVAAVVTNKAITLSWETVAPDAKYDIEVDGVWLNNGKDTLYNHTGLRANEYHTYKIRYKNENGTEYLVAVLALSTLPDPPGAITEIEVFASMNQIELRWQRVEGAEVYEIEVDGVTVSSGADVSYTHTNLSPGTAHTYRVRAKNTTGVTAWSPSIVRSTTSPAYIVNGVKDHEFDLSLLASNVQDFSEITFVVTYNPDELEVVDLYDFTPRLDLIAQGKIADSNLEVVFSPGIIEIRSNQSLVPGTSWSGEVTTISMKSRIDGQSEINVVVK